MTPPYGRVVTAMITPFDESGEIDKSGVRKIVAHLIDTSSDSIVVCGTTGESPTLEDKEKLALIETVLEEASGRVKVIAGTSTYDTRHSVRLTEQACALGVDAILAVTPYYNRPNQAGIKAHFEAMADASSVPLMLYNIPSRTGRRIEIDTLAHLSSHPRIDSVKDAVGDLSFTAKTVASVPDDFWVYSGDDGLTLPMLSVGAVGVVSVASHLAGRAISTMIQSFLDGRVAEARDLNKRLMGIFDGLFIEPNPIPLKAALGMCGMPAGKPRLPLTPATDETMLALKELMREAQDLLDISPLND